MSVGIGKGMRRWRNNAAAEGKARRAADELKERFGKRVAKPAVRKTPHNHSLITRQVHPLSLAGVVPMNAQVIDFLAYRQQRQDQAHPYFNPLIALMAYAVLTLAICEIWQRGLKAL